MNEDNEQLLRQFFSEAAQQQIEDNGFSEQVMCRLPMRINWFTHLWTACCILIATVLFYVFHGFELLAVQVEVFLRTLPATPITTNMMMMATILFSLFVVGASEVISSGTVRK